MALSGCRRDDQPGSTMITPGHFGGDPVAISRLAYTARLSALWTCRIASHSSCTSLETGKLRRERAISVRTRAGAVSGPPSPVAATAAQFKSERPAHPQRVNAETVNRELP
jgi:hypothetical protein